MTANPIHTLRSHLRYALAGGMLLVALAPARAESPPGIITPVSYASTVDRAAQIATFAIRFDRAPDFVTSDEFERPADQFQFWTDTVSLDPIQSTYAGILGNGPLGTQMMVTTTSVPVNNQLSYVWPQLITDPGPKDPGGWGSIEAYAGYALAGKTVSFDVPLALLHAPDGHFNYVFETYRYALGGYMDYFGVSGEDYTLPCVPEPAHAGMLGAGMLLLAGASRRGRRQR